MSLIHLVLINSDYFEHSHRLADLQSCFTRILLEEVERGGDIEGRGVGATGAGGGAGEVVNGFKERNMDRDIVLQIFKQFPQHFTCPTI